MGEVALRVEDVINEEVFRKLFTIDLRVRQYLKKNALPLEL